MARTEGASRNAWFAMFVEQVSFPAAFVAGLLSFLSPCILPLIPAYFTFITGYSLDELTSAGAGVRKKVILSTAAFIAGFSAVFILLGASASLAGGVLSVSYTHLTLPTN